MAVHFKMVNVRTSQYPLYANGLGEVDHSATSSTAGLTQTAEEAYAIRAATVAAINRAIEISKEVAASQNKPWLASIRAMDL